MKQFGITFLICLICLLSLAGCEKKEDLIDTITGTWQEVDGEYQNVYMKDGTGYLMGDNTYIPLLWAAISDKTIVECTFDTVVINGNGRLRYISGPYYYLYDGGKSLEEKPWTEDGHEGFTMEFHDDHTGVAQNVDEWLDFVWESNDAGFTTLYYASLIYYANNQFMNINREDEIYTKDGNILTGTVYFSSKYQENVHAVMTLYDNGFAQKIIFSESSGDALQETWMGWKQVFKDGSISLSSNSYAKELSKNQILQTYDGYSSLIKCDNATPEFSIQNIQMDP